MTPDINRTMPLQAEELYNLEEVIYHGGCPECDDPLDFELDADPDNPQYTAKCCGKTVVAKPTQFVIDSYDY